MEREKERETAYARAIEQQEAVIAKLQKLLEESVESQAKAREYQANIEGLDKQIGKIKGDIALVQPDEEDLQDEKWGESKFIQNEVLRLQRQNEQNMLRNAQMRRDLAEKRHMKKEIEDWLEEKVTTEFQLDTGRARLRAVTDEMSSNQRAFNQEKT